MKKRLRELWRQYLHWRWEKQILGMAALLALIPILAASLVHSEAPEKAPEKPAALVDTYIPKGFVLVPIEVQNYEALDSILGQFALVDLFQSASPQVPQPHLVARNVRILRAPKNPAHFAILVEEAEVPRVLKFGSQFTVIIKRPDKSGTEFVKSSPRRAIVYEGE